MTGKLKDPVLKDLWVKALESGEFKQGRGCLHSGSQHCGLGVLCEVYRRYAGRGTWEPTQELRRLSFVLSDDVGGHNSSILPAALVNEILDVPILSGLNIQVDVPEDLRARLNTAGIGVVLKRDGLGVLNDGGATFQEIAQLIKEQL